MMTNQITIVVRLSIEDGSVSAHVCGHRNTCVNGVKVQPL